MNPLHKREAKRKKVKQEIVKFVVEEHTTFSFAYIENAERVAIALASSGYFVRIRKDNQTYILHVFTYEKK